MRFGFAFLSVLAVPLVAQDPPSTRGGEVTIEVEVDRLGVLDQGRTGTCWSFATTSFLEAELLRIHGQPIDLSEMHTVYWGWLEKARRYVRLHGKNQLSQGGLSHDVVWLARRHGLVPADSYTGLLGGARGHDHDELEAVLRAVLDTVADRSRPSGAWESAVRGILDAYLGAPPPSVEVDGRSMTPREYARQVLAPPLDDYVELMSFTYAPFGEKAELLVPDNWMRDASYWNVPIDELCANVDHALHHGYSVALDCDVSERSNDRRRSVYQLTPALEGADITDEMRLAMFDSRETTDDHLMHIVGIASDESGKQYYVTKNSWGVDGPLAGNVLLTRNYLAAKTLGIMVHRDGLLPETRERLETGR